MTRLARRGQEHRKGYQEQELRGDGCEIRGDWIPGKTDLLLVLCRKKVSVVVGRAVDNGRGGRSDAEMNLACTQHTDSQHGNGKRRLRWRTGCRGRQVAGPTGLSARPSKIHSMEERRSCSIC